MTKVALSLVVSLAGVNAAAADLRVRATDIVAPCVVAAAEAYPASRVTVETGSVRQAAGVDVVVGSAVEMTRALEGGDAVIDSEERLARIPWVIASSGGGSKVASLADLARGAEVTLFGGPAAYEARRVLSLRPVTLRETTDPKTLRRARLAIVPLSVAGPGNHHTAADIPAITVTAAVAEGSRQPDAARAFVQFLVSPRGQSVFAACRPAP